MFQHFGIILFLIFFKILAAVLILNQKIVIISNNFEIFHFCIVDYTKYFSYFENYLKIFDNTYLSAHLLAIISLLYQNQKRLLSQNILRIDRMNLIFC